MNPYHLYGVVAVLGGIAFWRPRWALGITVIAAPAYLVKFVIFGVPVTLLEAMILGTVIGWCLRTVLEALYNRTGVLHYLVAVRSAVPRWAWFGLAALVIGWTVSTFRSVDTASSLGALKAWLIEPLLFGTVLLYELRSDARCKRTIERSLLIGLLWVSIAGLVQLAFFRETVEDGRLSSVFAPVANYFAMFAAPLIVYAFGMFVAGRDRIWSGTATVVGSCALLLSISYGGFLAAFAGIVVVLTLVLRRQYRKRAIVMLLIATAAGFVAFLPTRYFHEKINFSTRSSSLVRTEIWRTAIEVGVRHPLTGIGPNTFEVEYRKVAPELYHPPLEWLVAKPHNLYLNAWVETGVFGALGLLVLLIGFVIRTMRDDGRDRAGALLAGAAVLALGVHGFVDTPLFKNDLALLGAVLVVLGFTATAQLKNSGK